MEQNPSLESINHFIDRAEAGKLIGNYNRMKDELINPSFQRLQKEFGILPVSEAFNEKSILAILAQEGCVGIRIHYGIKMTMEREIEVPLVVAVLVGVAKDGSNMWGKAAVNESTQVGLKMAVTSRGEDEGVILEDSQRCPPFGDENPMP
jgi:hypothetical protein